jgi:hypothetical protein
LYKLPKDVLQHVLSIALGGVEAMCYAENVASLANKVLQIVFVAWQRKNPAMLSLLPRASPQRKRKRASSARLTFVGELVESNLLRTEAVVQIKKVQRGRSQLSKRGREDGRPQRRQGCLKVGLNQFQLLVLHLQLLVRMYDMGHQTAADLEQILCKEFRKVARHLFALLHMRERG